MAKKILLASAIIWGIISNGHVFAQTGVDSVGLSLAVANYDTAIGQQSHLYNGPEYEFYDPLIKGNAYVFDNKVFTPGSVSYGAAVYSDIPMLYDLNKDVVVVLLYNRFTKFSLLSERVHEFWLLNHHFIRINTDSTGKAALATGFYDQLYPGQKIEIIVKRAKSIQTATSSNTVESFFSATKDYYVKKGGFYFSFGGKRGLLDILKDKKKELKQYIKANNIDFDENFERATVNVATYYDQLTK
ncbi:hypothetical protein SAMN05192574_102119 [Mucilaginibacter gossypiicola]|uniref:Uncharacterized protein n=1 Tax=Mucilaginibacter gossypiicola TaxID=551995 RepID=A0A1H8CXI7_9SPHI|nr:hypothetical protein [Mucilaginibacter gossypiicola]SEM99715.1 hypothetical protein SAMN05192574_102119 [Mucilaginibacter gossypiicola]